MLDENFFFVRVREICTGAVAICPPDRDIVSVAAQMAEDQASAVVVCEGDTPVGVITDRDYRDAVARSDGTVETYRAADIMTSPLITIRRDDYAFEAVYKMARHKIHRLVVLDGARPSCVLTDTDLIALQTKSPLYLGREIEAAGDLPALAQVNRSLLEMVSFASRAGAGTKDIVRLISHFNDAVTQRVIVLLERREGIRCPDGAAYLVLGSEGRREQTLRTDQDSAMVFADELPADQVARVERFSHRLVEALIEIGVPPCPGRTMADNPEWRRSLGGWMGLLDQWVRVPTPERMVHFGMFQDLRTVWGDESLERRLKEHLLRLVARNSLFLPYLARNIVRFSPPLSLFGNLRTERSGDHKGLLDIKKAGLFAITEGVSLLGLEAGILDGSTWEKIEALRERRVLPEDDLERLDEAFSFLVKLRLRCQLEALAAGRQPSKWIDPDRLTAPDTEHLKEALTTVGSLLRTIRERYQLDFISR